MLAVQLTKGCELVRVGVSPPSPELTPHAYPPECPSDAEGPAAIGFATPEQPSPPGRTGRRSRNFSGLCLKVAGPLPLWWSSFSADRRSVRRTQRLTLDSQRLQRAVELRQERHHLRHIARLLAAPFSTVARALNRLGLGRLRNLEPKPPVQRYERERPGDLLHIDVKKLARYRKVGHRITGNRQQGRSTGVGYDRIHVAIDDTTRLAYVEVLADDQ